MTVKVIPISPEYRENWDSVFGKQTPRASGCPRDCQEPSHGVGREIRGVFDTSGGPVYMPAPLPASWGMVDGVPF